MLAVSVTDAEARSRLSALDLLFVIGLGGAFLSDLNIQGTCRNFQERAADAGAGDALGLVGGVSGMVLGGIAGSGTDTVLGTVGGAGLGAVLGREVGLAAGAMASAPAGQAAERATRDYADEYAFELCKLIVASDTLKAPLLRRYLQIGLNSCGLDPEQMQDMSNSEWNSLIDCNNGQNDEARNIVLQAMRINQATCYAIEALNNVVVHDEAESALARREGSVMPFAPSTVPDCDTRSPAQMWHSYLRDRGR
jgi:hypothetical protein